MVVARRDITTPPNPRRETNLPLTRSEGDSKRSSDNSNKTGPGSKSLAAWRPELEELKRKFSESAAHNDLDSCSRVAREMMKAAQVKERPAVAAFLNAFYSNYYDKRALTRHAPENQILSVSEARGILDQFMRQSDPSDRTSLYETLHKGRLPEEVLPDVLRVVDWSLTNKTESGGRLLSLLNCFVGPASAEALLSYAFSADSTDTKSDALRLLGERQLPPPVLAQLQEHFRTEPNGELRAGMLEVIWKAGNDGSTAAIRDAINDPNGGVRAIAAQVYDPTQENDKQTLLALARTDVSDQVREAALMRLSKILEDSVDILKSVTSIAASDPSESVREFAVRRLCQPGLINNSEVLAALRTMSINDPSERVRSEAGAALHLLEQ